MGWGRNRQNGVKAEGDLIKLLKERGRFSLPLSPNIPGDIIIPSKNIIIEVKRVKKSKTFSFSHPNQVEQYKSLKEYVDNGMVVYYAILFYDNINDGLDVHKWRFFEYRDELYKMKFSEGKTFEYFISLIVPLEKA
jgi:hypothetical protein